MQPHGLHFYQEYLREIKGIRTDIVSQLVPLNLCRHDQK